MPTSGPSLKPRFTDRIDAVRGRYEHWTRPTESGLPRASVLLWFPALCLVIGIVLVALTINGTSAGAYHSRFSSAHDPRLIAGMPQTIRSDEWNVTTSWTISQVEQGLPDTNDAYPGGTDAAIPQDLPRHDWSMIFRPHLWGFLFLDLDHAAAFKWWMPFGTMVVLAYALAITLLPRRPIVAAALAVGLGASPFLQWWFLPGTHWPMAWGLGVMTAAVWAFRSRRRGPVIAWAAIAGFLTPVMAMGIYAPFIVPVVIVTALGVIGAAIEAVRSGSARSLLRLVPLAVAGALGSVITLLWLHSEQKAVAGFLGTDYPGVRLTPTGQGTTLTAMQVLGAPFSEVLKRIGVFLGYNSSEASSFFLFGLFLIPVVVLVAVRAVRGRQRFPWMLAGLTFALLLLCAFAWIPGWDAIAHLLFLDRSSGDRARIGMGLASFAAVPALIAQLDRAAAPAGRIVAGVAAALFVVPQLVIAAALTWRHGFSYLLQGAPLWWAMTIAGGAAIILVARRRFAVAAVLIMGVGVVSTFNVNPSYLGVYDLRTTAVAKSMESLEAAKSGNWVGIGSTLSSALILETGMTGYNGVQGAPSKTMWHQIDPTGRYEYEWNRLGALVWTPGSGNPKITNPSADQILMTFDACAGFAQKHVGYVVADVAGVSSPCLQQVKSFPTPTGTIRIFEVIPKKS